MPFLNFTCKSGEESSLMAEILTRRSELNNPSSSSTEADGKGKRPPTSAGEQGEDSPLATVELSYRNLPDYLRRCLGYFCVYGKRRYSMEKRKLIWLLLAQGLIKAEPGEIREDAAEKNIEELAGLGMIREKDRTHVQIYRPCWDFSCPKVEKQEFIAACMNSPVHLACYGGDNDIPTNLNGIFIRSLFFIATQTLSGANLRSMFSGLKFLVVLDLEGRIEYLPDEVGDLIHLRYLGLENSDLDELPPSIGNLEMLQTLDIRMCGKLEKLPNEVLNMRHLRHLEMSTSVDDGEIIVPSGIGTLANLHTFTGLYAGSGIAGELGSLTQLRELGVKRVSDDHISELLESIMKMVGLVSLSLEAETTFFEEDDPTKTTLLPSLEPFLPPPLLRGLYLFGGLIELPAWIASMENLTSLTLSFSYLPENPTSVLQFLPKLKHLSFWHAYNFKYIGKEFCQAVGFPKLEILEIASHSLVEWTEVENGAFPSLKCLIFHCEELQLLPEGLQNISTLQELSLLPWPHDLARRLNGKEKYKIEHIPTLYYCRPLPSNNPE